MINWAQIDTVLLDMDGTLLDLSFDNFFILANSKGFKSLFRELSAIV